MLSKITKSAKETRDFAAGLASRLAGLKPRSAWQKNKALVIALEGELGSGKTTFIKGFSRALGVREKILSPTFVLIHRHKIKKGFKFHASSFTNLYHIDAYRLRSSRDLLKLGVKEIFANPKNIVLIEWADRVKKIVPKSAIWLHLNHAGKNKRKILIK